MSRLALIASSNDYLVEESLNDAVTAACDALGGAEVERVSDDASPEDLALELRSPSLFAPTRVLVVSEIRGWLDASTPAGALGDPKPADPEVLIEVIAGGLPDGTALVMGAWCGRQPKGPLVKAVKEAGGYRWIPLPDRPKPWEDVVLSDDQRRVLVGLLRKVAGDTRFQPAAEALLLDRLGFDPRRLVAEARTLGAAAGASGVDEELVRRLVFPRERSLEVVRDAVLQREPKPLLDLIAAAAGGAVVHDWQGRAVSGDRLGAILCGQVANLLIQMLDLRRTAMAAGLGDQLDPDRTCRDRWYQSVFSSDIAPVIIGYLQDDGPTPLTKKGKPPTPWTLGQLFRGASLYTDDELADGLVGCGEVEAAQRGMLKLEALTAWIVSAIGGRH